MAQAVRYANDVSRVLAEAVAAGRPMPKVVSSFHFKGGVGKSTNGVNIGFKFASKGINVLMVDCDPQCNMTQMCNLECRENLDWRDGVVGGDLYSAMKPIMDDEAHLFAPAPIVPIADRIYLLPGSMFIGKFSGRVGLAYSMVGSDMFSAFKSVVGSVRALVLATALVNDIDVVIMDLSPDSGGFNMNIVMNSDFLVTSVAPDALSLQGLRLMVSLFPDWREKQRQMAAATRAAPVVGFKSDPPIFLGIILARFNMAHPGGQHVVGVAYRRWFTLIGNYTRETLLPTFADIGMIADDGPDITVADAYKAGEVPEFFSLGRLAQHGLRPIFALVEDVIRQEYGTYLPDGKQATFKRMETQRLRVDNAFEALSVFLINRIFPLLQLPVVPAAAADAVHVADPANDEEM